MSDDGRTYNVASMGFSVLGGILKGMAAWQAGNMNADIDRQNARLAELAAGDAMVRGHAAAAYALLRGSALQAKQTTAYAGAGVAMDSGSALDVLTGTSLMSDLDARTIANNAAREAWGYDTTAANFRQKANIDETTARNQAGSSILGGITGAAIYAADYEQRRNGPIALS